MARKYEVLYVVSRNNNLMYLKRTNTGVEFLSKDIKNKNWSGAGQALGNTCTKYKRERK
jgi:hypothetical protein